MGTSGSYSGAGGKAGKEVSAGLGSWLDSLPSGAGDGGAAPAQGDNTHSRPVTQLPPQLVSGLLGLLRPAPGSGSGRGGGAGGGIGGGGGRSSGGSGGGGTKARTGSGRSTSRLSSVGGRAAAGAYAFATGDRAALQGLGLGYDALRSLSDPFEVTRRIVDAVCGPRANSTLEEAEERYVAASVADWVLTQSADGSPPEVDEVARYAIATIITEVISSEMSEALRERPGEVAEVAESELKDAAFVLAGQATLSVSGATGAELAEAIESGIETLRTIYGGKRR